MVALIKMNDNTGNGDDTVDDDDDDNEDIIHIFNAGSNGFGKVQNLPKLTFNHSVAEEMLILVL